MKMKGILKKAFAISLSICMVMPGGGIASADEVLAFGSVEADSVQEGIQFEEDGDIQFEESVNEEFSLSISPEGEGYLFEEEEIIQFEDFGSEEASLNLSPEATEGAFIEEEVISENIVASDDSFLSEDIISALEPVSNEETDPELPWEGAGTQSNPYLIGNIDDLKNLSHFVNNGFPTQNIYFKLTASIDLGGEAWTPIGFPSVFNGYFDGNGYTISNLTVRGVESPCGLFGITALGEIRNLTLNNVNVTGNGPTGALIGDATTIRITDCHVSGNIDITGPARVGGLVGEGAPNLINCSVKGSSGRYGNITAIPGGQSLDGSTFEGDCVGGIIGAQVGDTLENSSCTVQYLNLKGTARVGGICGTVQADINLHDGSADHINIVTSADYSFADTNREIFGLGGVIGIIGVGSRQRVGIVKNISVSNINISAINDAVNSCAKMGIVSGGVMGPSFDAPRELITDEGIQIGGTNSITGEILPVNNYPIISAVNNDFITDDNGDYHIKNLKGLKAFRNNVNAGRSFKDEIIYLDADISLSNENWDPIGTMGCHFMGEFDGNGKTVSDLEINHGDTDGVGFFGVVNGGQIRNLCIENASVNGDELVAAVAGVIWFGGSVINCHVTGNIDISGHTRVGGIVGEGDADLKNCSVKGTSGRYGNITATSGGKGQSGNNLIGDKAGGIAGYQTGELHESDSCNVQYLNVTGTQEVGGAFGAILSNFKISNGTADHINVVTGASENYASVDGHDGDLGVGGYIGLIIMRFYTSAGIVNNITVSNINLSANDSGVNKYAKMGLVSGGLSGVEFSADEDLIVGTNITVSGSNTSTGERVPTKNLPIISRIARDVSKDSDYQTHIKTLSDLKTFRDNVNSGNTFEGKYVYLDGDITMDDDSWIPIGSSEFRFMGTFDGGGNKITGLKINNYNEPCAGLFGFVENASISNLTIVNPTISTSEGEVGSLAGRLTNSKAYNCHVKGNIKISSNHDIGGLIGTTKWSDIENCSVIGDDKSTSILTGVFKRGKHENDDARNGGIIGGLIAAQGITNGNSHTNKGCTVKNLTIKGNSIIGGMYGSDPQIDITLDATVDNVDLIVTCSTEFAEEQKYMVLAGGMSGWMIYDEGFNSRGRFTGKVSNVNIKCEVPEVNKTVKMGIISGGDETSEEIGVPKGIDFSVTVSGKNSTTGLKVSDDKTAIYSALKNETSGCENGNHKAVIVPGKKPTCTETGLTDGEKCSVCGEILLEQKLIPATGHTSDKGTITKAATVLEAGKREYKCVHCGKVMKTESIPKLTASLILTVDGAKIKNKEILYMWNGKKLTVKASKLASGDSIKSVSSSDKSIATATHSGKTITINSKNKGGKAKITVTLASGKTQIFYVQVSVKTTKISNVPSKVTVSKGKTYKIKASLVPASSTEGITYKSSNKKIATVNSKGVVTGVKAGTAKITVKSGSVSKTISVTVK